MASQHTFLDQVPPGNYEMPAGAKQERCRSCGALIVWGKTASGSAMPLDVLNQLTIDGKRYGRTHFATCPQGREWRRHS